MRCPEKHAVSESAFWAYRYLRFVRTRPALYINGMFELDLTCFHQFEVGGVVFLVGRFCRFVAAKLSALRAEIKATVLRSVITKKGGDWSGMLHVELLIL